MHQVRNAMQTLGRRAMDLYDNAIAPAASFAWNRGIRPAGRWYWNNRRQTIPATAGAGLGYYIYPSAPYMSIPAGAAAGYYWEPIRDNVLRPAARRIGRASLRNPGIALGTTLVGGLGFGVGYVIGNVADAVSNGNYWWVPWAVGIGTAGTYYQRRQTEMHTPRRRP